MGKVARWRRNQSMPQHYRLLGGPGSPYSLKLRAILRYRRIPHVWLVPHGYLTSGVELSAAGKGMIPVLQLPDGSYQADSTPIAYGLEWRHPGGRSILPLDAGHAFLSHMIEDLGDELLVQSMFDLRWNQSEDVRFCSRRQMSGWLSPMAAAEFDRTVDEFVARQTAQRARMVDTTSDASRALLRATYLRVLDAIERMLEQSGFLFGGRPALADCGLYGQLSQCAIDPSASAIMRERAPRTYQWVQLMDDASGVEGEWSPAACVNPAVDDLLALAGEIYLPYLVANADAIVRGQKTFEARFGGQDWRGRASPYRRKCLTWLRRELAGLPVDAVADPRARLQRHGCWQALQADARQDAGVADMAPL